MNTVDECETAELRISDLIKSAISQMPKKDWKVLAIDIQTDVIVLKRKTQPQNNP